MQSFSIRKGLQQPIRKVPHDLSSESAETIFFFKRQNYIVSASAGGTESVMKITDSLLDSSADPNFVQLPSLAENWRVVIRLKSIPLLIETLRRPLRSLGSLVLFVRVGQTQARFLFSVVASKGVDCILGTTFIDRHARAVVLPQRKTLFHFAPALAVLGFYQPSTEVVLDASCLRTGLYTTPRRTERLGWSKQSLA